MVDVKLCHMKFKGRLLFRYLKCSGKIQFPALGLLLRNFNMGGLEEQYFLSLV